MGVPRVGAEAEVGRTETHVATAEMETFTEEVDVLAHAPEVQTDIIVLVETVENAKTEMLASRGTTDATEMTDEQVEAQRESPHLL
jgi:hypothetical protein